ncbi:DUF72 domain-containing protein [Paenibacillus larvae]
MIQIGLTGWGDHEDLYEGTPKSKDRLPMYCGHFPIVEVDSCFYEVQSLHNMSKWTEQAPDSFSFICKAYQGMTGHLRGKNPFTDTKEMFDAYLESLRPMREAGKLKAVLFQYPPWFTCIKENVDILKETRERMKDVPVALEFRHQSWFVPEMREKTLAFMKREQWIHSICDEPQAGEGSIPTVAVPTDEKLTLVRLHGRNVRGWNQSGNENWREVRYLYRYNEQELKEWAERLRILEQSVREIAVIFNNNSGGDAAANAKQLINLLDIDYQDLAPRQLDLF